MFDITSFCFVIRDHDLWEPSSYSDFCSNVNVSTQLLPGIIRHRGERKGGGVREKERDERRHGNEKRKIISLFLHIFASPKVMIKPPSSQLNSF